MPIYHCSICNVEFKKKWNYDYHISRKNPCKMEDEQESENNTCRHCHKTYSSKSNLNTHLKICKFMKLQGFYKMKKKIKLTKFPT